MGVQVLTGDPKFDRDMMQVLSTYRSKNMRAFARRWKHNEISSSCGIDLHRIENEKDSNTVRSVMCMAILRIPELSRQHEKASYELEQIKQERRIKKRFSIGGQS